MTREKAIECLNYQNEKFFGGQSEALKMAISALSEELSEDGTLTVHVSDGSKVKRVFVMGDNIFGGLYYPDSVENKGEWIPVSERLPEIMKWEKDFKGFVDLLDMPRDDYNGIMSYIDELLNILSRRCEVAQFCELHRACPYKSEKGGE